MDVYRENDRGTEEVGFQGDSKQLQRGLHKCLVFQQLKSKGLQSRKEHLGWCKLFLTAVLHDSNNLSHCMV